MIVCALFTIAGIIAWQNTLVPKQEQEELENGSAEIGFFIIVALACWTIAGLAGAGVIGQS